jgi:hypothetical protein
VKVTLLTMGFAVLLAGCADLLPPPDTRLAQQQQISNRVNAAMDKWGCENGYNHVSHEVPARPPSATGYYPSQGSFASNRDGDSPITADVCAKYGLDQQWLQARREKAKAKGDPEDYRLGPIYINNQMYDIEFFNAATEAGPATSGPTAEFDMNKVLFVGWRMELDNIDGEPNHQYCVDVKYFGPDGLMIGSRMQDCYLVPPDGILKGVFFSGRTGNSLGHGFLPGEYRVQFTTNGRHFAERRFDVLTPDQLAEQYAKARAIQAEKDRVAAQHEKDEKEAEAGMRAEEARMKEEEWK